MKKIAVITTGGDAPGMNAAIRAVVRTAHYCNFRISGIKRGWWGLIENDFFVMTNRDVSGIISRGGTILETLRCAKSKTKWGMDLIVKNLGEIAPDGLVVIGGDGSLKASYEISKRCGVPVIGIPASIDNDIAGTDETIGFDTAINTALSAIDKIRDTATSHERVFIVEVMGRSSGFLALSAGIAAGAEIVLLPEIKWKKENVLKKLVSFEKRKSSLIIVMAEGAGGCRNLCKYLSGKSDKQVRVSKIGYIQRGGSPSVDSRVLGSVLGYRAVELIKKGKKNLMCAWVNDGFRTVPLSYPAGHRKKIDREMLKISNVLSG
ncbi:MAG: ATP-dependent 6-phosphofructokinase [bacterium]